MVTSPSASSFLFFFFNDTATTEIYTLSLHDALPISRRSEAAPSGRGRAPARSRPPSDPDRKSTRLNSSHSQISYAVFCLKKKKQITARDAHAIRHHLSRLRGASPLGIPAVRPSGARD